MNDIFNIPMPVINDDPARVGTPDYPEWSEGEREQLISDRADEIQHDVRKMFDADDGRTVKIDGQEYTKSMVVISFFERLMPEDLAPLFTDNPFRRTALIEKWAEMIATEEVDEGVYP